jgi:hypothetical protein
MISIIQGLDELAPDLKVGPHWKETQQLQFAFDYQKDDHGFI